MTGPDHFREAERLLREAAHDHEDGPFYMEDDGPTLVAALVHATLAGVAASAELSNIRGGYSLGPGQNSQPHLGRHADRTAAWSKAFGNEGEEG